jgi:hypothetical protein
MLTVHLSTQVLVLTGEKARVPYFVILHLRKLCSKMKHVINASVDEFKFPNCDSASPLVIVADEGGTFVRTEDSELQAEQSTVNSSAFSWTVD